MGTNSIKTNLTKDLIISDIKLLLGADINKANIYIVVEGEDDSKFLSKYFDTNVTIYESPSGKHDVENIVCSEIICNDRVIGIRDKDYCNNVKNKKIFFYDGCCLEMMIVENDKTFEAIYYEYYKGAMQPKDLKKHILDELLEVSLVRKYNEEEKLSINFKGLSFQSIIDSSFKIDKSKFYRQLKELNPNKSFKFIENLSNKNTHNRLDITNGHDFISLFKVICDKNCNSKATNVKDIASSLRCSFSEDFLRNTTLYRNLSNYFNNINIKALCC